MPRVYEEEKEWNIVYILIIVFACFFILLFFGLVAVPDFMPNINYDLAPLRLLE